MPSDPLVENQPTTDVETVSATLRAARIRNTPLAEFPGQLPSALATSYEIQDRSISLWPDTIVGWKVGGVPPHLHDTLGAKRLAGPIFSKTVKYATPGERLAMPSFTGGFVAVEAEWVFELGDTSSLDTATTNPDDIAKVVRSVHAGVEIASSPMLAVNDLGPTAVVSDFGNNFGLIIGPEIPDWSDALLSSTPITVDINGVEVGNTPSQPGLAGGLGAVRFLVDNLRSRGIEDMAGFYVSSGAITGVHQAKIGDTSRCTFAGHAEFDIDLVPIKT